MSIHHRLPLHVYLLDDKLLVLCLALYLLLLNGVDDRALGSLVDKVLYELVLVGWPQVFKHIGWCCLVFLWLGVDALGGGGWGAGGGS